MKINFWLLILITLIYSCTSNPSNKDIDKKNRLLVEIQQTEKKLYSDTVMNLDIGAANNAIILYSRFATQNPDDTASAEYLFRAAEICKALNKGRLALSYYERIENDYSTFPKKAVCIFMQGFVNENLLLDYDKAKYHYERFLKEYPNHALAKDTKVIIQNLGKTPEELIKSFQEKEKNNTSPNT
jgi:outer membrane protein assembly factor BamD (BamD/ComL family)